MAIVKPFRGIRYDQSTVGDLSDVISPPYDVISPADRIRFHEKNPYNFVRLILGEERSGDNDSENRFTRARGYLDSWLSSGVFKREATPAVYVYEQEYSKDGHTYTIRGFTLLVRIEDYANKVVLPHENTLAKPKSDLIKLIRETKANFDSVYSLYPDPDHALTQIMDDCAASAPTAEAVDHDSVRHKLWVVDSEDLIQRITDFLSDKELVIADGHHRYETSLAYRNEMRALEGPVGEERSYDYIMMTIINVYGKDVVIYPTHRMVRNLSADIANGVESRLSDRFLVETANVESITKAMAERGGAAIGMVTGDSAYLLTLKEPWSLENASPALSALDLTVLHRLILEDTLGIDGDRLKNEANIVYTRDEREAIDKAKSGEFQISFLLNPVNVESVLKVAREGEKMPQKATYFYPKLISGLALRQM